MSRATAFAAVLFAAVRVRAAVALAVLAVLAGLTAPAQAEPAADALARLALIDLQVERAHQRGELDALPEVADCRAAVKAGAAAGVKASTALPDRATTFGRAGALCDDLAVWHRLRAVREQIAPALTIAVTYAPLASADRDLLRVYLPQAEACLKAIDGALAAGLPAGRAFLPADNLDRPMTLPEQRAVCVELRDRGGTAKAQVAAEAKAAEAALRAKWTKLGATGARLAYLMKVDHLIVLGKDCRELTPKQRVKAAVFYQVNEDAAAWHVWKTTFPGGKQRDQVKAFDKLTQRWRCW